MLDAVVDERTICPIQGTEDLFTVNRNPSSCAIFVVGGGIGSLAAAAFMIRDGGVPGKNITIYEAAARIGRKPRCRRATRKTGTRCAAAACSRLTTTNARGSSLNRFPPSADPSKIGIRGNH